MRNRMKRSERGISAVDILVVLLFVSFFAYHFAFVPYYNQQMLYEIKNSTATITVAEQKIINEYRQKEAPATLPAGEYIAEGSMEGKEYKMVYLFQNDRVIKEITIMDKYTLSGSAKYAFQGSVMFFSDIKGDKGLFPEYGQAIGVKDQELFLPSDDEAKSITLKSGAALSAAEITEKERLVRINNSSIFDLSASEIPEKLLSRKYMFAFFGFIAVLLGISVISISIGRFREWRKHGFS